MMSASTAAALERTESTGQAMAAKRFDCLQMLSPLSLAETPPAEENFHLWAGNRTIPAKMVTEIEHLIHDRSKPVVRRNPVLGRIMKEELFERARMALPSTDSVGGV